MIHISKIYKKVYRCVDYYKRKEDIPYLQNFLLCQYVYGIVETDADITTTFCIVENIGTTCAEEVILQTKLRSFVFTRTYFSKSLINCS